MILEEYFEVLLTSPAGLIINEVFLEPSEYTIY